MSKVQLDIRKNESKKQYEAEFEGHTVFISYIEARGKTFLTHTEVPTALEGRGVGSSLVAGVLQILEEEGTKLFPLCPFVASWLRRHPEKQSILAEGVHV